MARTNTQIQSIDDVLSAQFGSTVNIQKINAPFTTIVNRAQMTDLSKDLGARVGTERIPTQQISLLQNEVGALGELVFRPINDIHEQIRFVGPWTNNSAADGQHLNSGQPVNSYAEVTFYGTGLNVLINNFGGTNNLVYAVDGGSNSSSIFPASLTAVITAGRKTSSNCVLTVVSGLSLGLHTVKLTRLSTSANSFSISGFEILNESTTMKFVPGSASVGGKLVSLATLQSRAYDKTAVLESGSLSSGRGGRVVAYLKPDGTIGMAATSVNAAFTFATSITDADRATEEVVRNIHWREFGAGRSDDFSTLDVTSSNRVFTLDDAVTTLTTLGGNTYTSAGVTDVIAINSDSARTLTLTFVGTGLDIIVTSDNTDGVGTDTFGASVDGGTMTNFISTAVGSNIFKTLRIASGLPYGTHTVNFKRTVTPTNWNLRFANFVIYGPKTPAIPAGSVSLAQWNVLADYANVSSFGVNITDRFKMSTGVIRKASSRESTYQGGGWLNAGIDVTNFSSGFNMVATAGSSNGASVSHTFFGTGIELRSLTINAAVYNWTLTLNGNPLSTYGASVGTVANGSGLTLSTAGALTGTYSGGQDTILYRISGLPLARYTLKILKNETTSNLYIDSFDVITPVHAPLYSTPGSLQSTQNVGSSSVESARKFGDQLTAGKKPRNWSQAVGVTSGPSTTATAFVPIPDMSCIIDSQTGLLDLKFVLSWSNTVAADLNIQFYIDGSPVGMPIGHIDGNSNAGWHVSTALILTAPVPIGKHLVQVYWKTGSTVINGASTWRILTVTDIG